MSTKRAEIELPTLEEDAAIQRGIEADEDNPEWTAADFAQARPAARTMPPEVYAGLVKRGRPRGATPPRVLLTLRVPAEVRDTLRGTGPGWQTRAAEALTRMAARDPDLMSKAGSYLQSMRGADMKQPGLDGRHRDKDGEISRKHGNTRVGTLRTTYGADFARGIRADAKLSNVLDRLDKPSLSRLVTSSGKKGG